MTQAWDINNIRKIAGLKPLTEGPWYEKDDDDEDRDAKVASSDKNQRKFEKKNKSELATANKEASAKKPAAKESKPDPEKKPEVKQEPAEEVEKKEVAAAEAKRRGKAPNENSFNQQAKKYAREHSRGSFIKWAADTHGKGKNYASALFAKYNPKSSREVKESAEQVWIITHPQLKSHTLSENVEMNQLQWIDANTDLNTMIFATEAEANKTLKYLREWKSWDGIVEQIEFDKE